MLILAFLSGRTEHRLLLGSCLFKYGLFIIQDIAQKWQEVRGLVPKRDTTLQQEMIRQQNNERLRRQFAQKANVVGQWIERHLDAVASVGIQKGSLEVRVEPTVNRTQVRMHRDHKNPKMQLLVLCQTFGPEKFNFSHSEQKNCKAVTRKSTKYR